MTKKVGNRGRAQPHPPPPQGGAPGAEPLEARADCDYVLMARREALARPFAELVDDLRRAFRAVGRNETDGRGPAVLNTPKGKNRRP